MNPSSLVPSASTVATVTSATVVIGTTALYIAQSRSPTVKELLRSVGRDMGLVTESLPTSATQPIAAGSHNAIRTTWTAPPGTSAQNALKAVQGCLEKYPQNGQGGIDRGGWNLMGQQSAESNAKSEWTATTNGGYKAHFEFKSGIGKFAKYMNGGKPFIDDLLLEVVVPNPKDDKGSEGDDRDVRVEVRSSSRKGFSDLGVNAKRVKFLAEQLPIGWTKPKLLYPFEQS